MPSIATAYLLPALLLGAYRCDTGGEPGYWESHSVVYGTFDSIQEFEKGHRYKVMFIPHVTLAGNFDSSRYLLLQLNYTQDNETRQDPSSYGKNVVVVLERNNNTWTVGPDGASYMPEGNQVLAVSGLGDPKVEEVVESLKRTRRSFRDFTYDLNIELKEKARSKNITPEQIQQRVQTLIGQERIFTVPQILKQPFSDADPTPIEDLATVSIQFIAPLQGPGGGG